MRNIPMAKCLYTFMVIYHSGSTPRKSGKKMSSQKEFVKLTPALSKQMCIKCFVEAWDRAGSQQNSIYYGIRQL